MGTKFFANKPMAMPGNMNAEGRAINAGANAGRQDGGTAQKLLANAIGAYQKHGFKPDKRGAAYPPGPKKV